MKKIYNLNHIKIFLLYLILFSCTLIIFYDHEPGIDQIRHMSWSQDLINSSFFLDTTKLSLEQIKNLNSSIFVNLFKPAYSDLGHLFNLFPIIILSIFIYLFENIVFIFNLISVTFFVGNLYLAHAIYEKFFTKINNNISLILFFALIFSSYYFFYAPLGIHNISLFFNLLVIYYLKDNDNKWSNNKLFFLIIIITLGIYSHKINLVLLIPSVFFYFFINKNFKILFKYSFIQLFLLTPIFIIIYFFPETLISTKKFAQIDISLFNYLNNFFMWFKNLYLTIGLVPIIFFLIGLYFIKKKKNSSIILIFIFTHIFFYIFINSFSLFYIRTNLYINYLVLLIGFYGFISLLEIKKKKVTFIIVIFLTIHTFLNSNNFYQFFLEGNYSIYNKYYTNNGKIQKSLKNIEKYFSENSEIIFLDNKVQDYFKIYKADKFYKDNIFRKPLKNLINDKNSINKIFNTQVSIQDIIMVSLTNDILEGQRYIALISKLNDTNCNYKLEKIKFFENIGPNKENLELNKVICN